jgi:hypothetical protein
MLATLLTFAASAATEDEPSKALFYVLGGLAAAWAVLLFLVGMRSTRFPGSAGAFRGVIAISVLLTLAAMASSVATS